MIGILLTVLGIIVATSSHYLVDLTGRYERACDRNLVKNVHTTGSILGQSGVMLLGLGMFGAGATSPGLEARVRASLFIGGAIILVLVLLALGFLTGFSPIYC
ncbi:MAG: hypothetical protein LN412_02360 [Candidatus Thermoplasmatota archaeon]|nr:hypothetical protein [Candidatus Thermoplasmatota archaeon]